MVALLEKNEAQTVESADTGTGLEMGLEMNGGWTKVTARKKRSKRNKSSSL